MSIHRLLKPPAAPISNEAAQLRPGPAIGFLSFSRRRDHELRTININHLVLDTLVLLRRSLGEPINVTTSLDSDAWNVHIRPSEFKNALLTLAANARDAMPNGGGVVIETLNVSLTPKRASDKFQLTPGDYVRLAVSDTSCATAPEALARFDLFFTTRIAEPDAGLARIYEFIRRSGGNATICIEPGRGTTVNLYLPRVGLPEVRESFQAKLPRQARSARSFAQAGAPRCGCMALDQIA